MSILRKYTQAQIFHILNVKNFLNIWRNSSELDISKKELNIDGHLVSTLGGCGGLERTDLLQFLLWEDVVVLKELILTVSSLGGLVVLKELILTVSTLGRCAGLKRTDFNSFYFERV